MEPSLNKKDELLRMLSTLDPNRITKEDFVKAYEFVVENILTFEKNAANNIKEIHDALLALTEKLKKDTEKDVSDEKQKLGKVFADKLALLGQKVSEWDAKVAALKDGDDGNDADEAAIVSKVLEELKNLPKEEQELMKPTAEETRDLLETLAGDERLKMEAIAGLEDLLAGLKKSVGKATRTVPAGAARGTQLYVDGTKKGMVNQINLKSGSGTTLSYSLTNGLPTVTVTVSGSGITIEAPTETPDGSQTTFTVLNTPKYVVADGLQVFSGKGYSYAAGIITMDLAPSFIIRSVY